MQFNLVHSLEILERTPTVLHTLLHGLSDEWIFQNEGPDTWSPFDVVGHLIHGERTDWMVRLRIILEHGTARPFDRFDRFAQFEESQGKTLDDLLEEFARLRQENLAALNQVPLDEATLDLKGMHPVLGEVTMRQLLACWTAHDLGHLLQISRTMQRQYREAVGPWRAFLSALQ